MATETTEKNSTPISENKGRFKINIEKLQDKNDTFFVEKIGNEYVVITNSEKKNRNANENTESEKNNNENNNHLDVNRRRSLHLSPHYFEESKDSNNKNENNNDNNNASNVVNEKNKNNDELIKDEQIIRQSELLWKSLLSKQPSIGKEILLELIKDYSNIEKNFNENIIGKDFMYATTPRNVVNENDNNNNENNDPNNHENNEENIENLNKNDLNKMGKWLSFWMSSIISRANEPYFIFSQLNKLEQIGINEKNFDNFVEIINQQYLKQFSNNNSNNNNNNNNNQNEQQLQSLNDVLSRIQTLLTPPQCNKCGQRMQRQVPKDIKPCQTPNVYGLCLAKMSRSDQIPFCKSCEKSLEKSDLAFVCLNCGAYGVIRIIRNGKLKGMLVTKGNSLCLECVYNRKQAAHDDSSENDQ